MRKTIPRVPDAGINHPAPFLMAKGGSNRLARAIRKAALTCFPRLRRFFAHELALCTSGMARSGLYAGINHPAPFLMAKRLLQIL
ncbi:hypothetical protein [Catenibacillus scindens]|uniref:hypothetical protein n=1 Tax=Catenibacillus scindens TaxID=673271 RepID=UPI00320971FF